MNSQPRIATIHRTVTILGAIMYRVEIVNPNTKVGFWYKPVRTIRGAERVARSWNATDIRYTDEVKRIIEQMNAITEGTKQ